MDSRAATAGPSSAATPPRPPARTKRDRLRQKAKEAGKSRRVSFMVPDDVPSVEMAVIEPVAAAVAEEEEVQEASRWEPNRGVNCCFVDQLSQLCLLGVPLTDMWFAFFSVFLLLASNALLVHVCVTSMKRQDARYVYVLAWLVVERLVAAIYRCWSSTQKGCVNALANMLVGLVYLDTFATAISLVCMAKGAYMVNLFAVEGTAKTSKQWTALPFLSAPGRLVTRMKMMCLLSSGAQSWQILGMVAALTDKTNPLSERESLQVMTSVTCSTIFLCWAATCSLPTIPVPQLFSNGVYVVFRTALKMTWLVCIALSRLTAFYVFSVAHHYHLLALGGAQCLAVFSYCLAGKCCAAAGPGRPSVVKLLVVSSVYVFVFVHPQKGHLDHGYGLFHFFYLGENLVIMYAVLEVANVSIRWVFISVGFYTAGILCLFCLTMLNIFVPHQNVRVDKSEPVASS